MDKPADKPAMDKMEEAEMGHLTVGRYIHFAEEVAPTAESGQGSMERMSDARMCEVVAGRRPWSDMDSFERALLMDALPEEVTVYQELTLKTYERGCDIAFLPPIEHLPTVWNPDWQHGPEITKEFLKRYRLVDVSEVPRRYHTDDLVEGRGLEMRYETPLQQYTRYYRDNPMFLDGEQLKVAAVQFVSESWPAESDLLADALSESEVFEEFKDMVHIESGCTYKSGYVIIFDYGNIGFGAADIFVDVR